MSAPRSYSPFPGPHYGERVLVRFCNISGAQNLSGFPRFLPGHWALGLQKLPPVRFNFCAWICRANGTWSVNGGRPKGLPYPNPEGIIKTRRGGTCPFRGPDRPLRNRDSLRIRCRGGPIWPPVLEVSAASL